MLQIIRKIVGTKNDRELKRLGPVIDRINDLEATFEPMSEEELRAKTAEFRSRLEDGETLDDLLPEAFAAVREASKRTTGMRHYDVQLIGGMVLHRGRIAEMKTGEGKTLVATLALYLNALTGKGAHLVTVNDYLARRDVQWMGPIYHLLGLSTASIIHDASFVYDPEHIVKDYRFQSLRPVSRKEAYFADITYGTNNELGFDYLRDNMKLDLEEYVQRELHFAIVDEVDNILIDESRTPLIISGPSELATDEYYRVNRIIPKLQRDTDYTIDEKLRQVMLTDDGVAKVERLLGVSNLYDPQEIAILHHVNAALKAHALYRREVDYVVKDNQVIIVDEFTGRLMTGRRWSDGLHQAVEAKEGVPIQRENQTLATITIQNFFRMYDKLSGMTGTADTEAVEFKKTYGLDVFVVPSNRPNVRDDLRDLVYRTEKEKFDAVIEDIEEKNEAGRPVLIGTISVEKSETLARLLKKAGIRHHVLNAVNHELEATIIAQAGRKGAVTIATNMAGRGTDILLGGNPEFLARSEMENEWIRKVGRVADEHGGTRGAKRYEEELQERRDAYDDETRAIREDFEEKLAEWDAKRKEALGRETEARQELFDGSPLAAQRRRYEQILSHELIPAVGDGRRVGQGFLPALESLDDSLLDSAGESETAKEFAEVSRRFRSAVERWEDPAWRSREGILPNEEPWAPIAWWGRPAEGVRPKPPREIVNTARSHYDRVRVDLELEILIEGGAAEPDLVERYRAAVRDREQAEEEHTTLEGPFREALARASEKYEAKRQELVDTVESVRTKIEQAPHEFEERFQEIYAEFEKICAEERDDVKEAGGLHIIGTERHESRRIDNQLRGRAGRQGDPGSSRFYLSLQDDLLRIFGAERIEGLMHRLGMEEGVPIESGMIDRAVSNAQTKVESHHFDVRKHLLEYDDVLNKQREVVYHRRRDILSGEGLRDEVLEIADGLAEEIVTSLAPPDTAPADWNWEAIGNEVQRQFAFRLEVPEPREMTPESLETAVKEGFRKLYDEKEAAYGDEILRRAEKFFMLQTLDGLWKDHLLNMDHLREGIGLRGYGQKNPLREYQREGFDLFGAMMEQFEADVVERLAHVRIEISPGPAARPAVPDVRANDAGVRESHPDAVTPGRQEQAQDVMDRLEQRQKAVQAQAATSNRGGPAPKTETVKREGEKVGRNDPCPCGSGKKYKKCHGAAA